MCPLGVQYHLLKNVSVYSEYRFKNSVIAEGSTSPDIFHIGLRIDFDRTWSRNNILPKYKKFYNFLSNYLYKSIFDYLYISKMKKNRSIIQRDNLIVLYAAVFAVFAFLFLHLFFKQGVNDFTIEILAATLGASFTVSAMMVVMKIQSRHEREGEFAKKLFDKKIEMYQIVLELIFKMDDDNIIDKEEIESVENKIGEASMVASAELVSAFSQFIVQLKIYGTLYPRSMTKMQIVHYVEFFNKHPEYLATIYKDLEISLTEESFKDYFVSLDNLVQLIREDLSVVEGDIQQMLEHFVEMPMDKFGLMKNPNIVD